MYLEFKWCKHWIDYGLGLKKLFYDRDGEQDEYVMFNFANRN